MLSGDDGGALREGVVLVKETEPGSLRAAAGSKEARPVADDDDLLDRANRPRSTHGPRVDELMRRPSQLTPEEATLFVEVFPSIVDEHYDDLMPVPRREVIVDAHSILR